MRCHCKKEQNKKKIVQKLTSLANLEQLVGIPANNTSRETTPAPLDDTSNDLRTPVSPRYAGEDERGFMNYHWLGHAQLLAQCFTREAI